MDGKNEEIQCEQQSKKCNKIKESAEIFVLSPLFLQNLGISIKDITQETSVIRKKRDGTDKETAQCHQTSNVITENKPKANNNHDVSKLNKTIQEGTSIAETANLMKNSVFMSPTFVPTENDMLIGNVKSKEIDTSNNLSSNEETTLERNILIDTPAIFGSQVASSGVGNANDRCLKDIECNKLSSGDTSLLNVNDCISSLTNSGLHDYTCKSIVPNENSNLNVSIPNDTAIFCESGKSNSQNKHSNLSGHNDRVEKMYVVDDSYNQEGGPCFPLQYAELEQTSKKEIDSLQEQISYNDKINTEYIENLDINKESELISDGLIELNELIPVNNNNTMSISENENINECVGISTLVGTDFTDFESMDSLNSGNNSSQNINTENHINLEKRNELVVNERELVHANKDLHNGSENDVCEHSLYSRNTQELHSGGEGRQYDFCSATTKELVLKPYQTEKRRQLSVVAADENSKLQQFPTSYHIQYSKKNDVPSKPAEIDFGDNSKILVCTPTELKNVDNECLDSTYVTDSVEKNKLQKYNTLISNITKTDDGYIESKVVSEETIPISSLLSSTDRNSINYNILDMRRNVINPNVDHNLSVSQDRVCVSEAHKANDDETVPQSKLKANLSHKLKSTTVKKEELKKHHCGYFKCKPENIGAHHSQCRSPTYKNQFSVTETGPNTKTNVNLIASYLKQITKVQSQGQQLNTSKNNKKISKLSVQGVEKPGGSENLIHKEEKGFHFSSGNLKIKKTYNRKKYLNKQSKALIDVNEICEIPNPNSLDYSVKHVPVDITMGFCVCVDYGHISYGNSYVDLEHLHYENKVSNDFNTNDFVTNRYGFNFSKRLSDEISEAMGEVTETPDTHTSSICWKSTEELLDYGECIIDEKKEVKYDNTVLGKVNMNMIVNKFREKTSDTNVSNNDTLQTVDISKFNDYETSIQQTCCLDPKLQRNRLGSDTSGFLPMVAKRIVPSNDSVYKSDLARYSKTSDAFGIQKLTVESKNLLVSSNAAEVDNVMDEEIQNENTADIDFQETGTSKRSRNYFTNTDDINNRKKMKSTINESSENEMNMSSSPEVLSQCPEFLLCDICKLNIKTEEWVNHECVNSHIIIEEKSNLTEIPGIINKACLENQEVYESGVEELAFASGFQKDNSSELQCTCGVCNRVIDTKEWASHIQKEHNYLAWRKNETPIDFTCSNIIKEHLINVCKTFGLLICKHCGLKQKRYRRSYEGYVDIYLKHVELCANQASQMSNATDEVLDFSNNQRNYTITEDINNSQLANEATLSNIDNKVIEAEQAFSCGVCEQIVQSTEWMKHVQTQHSYLAWKKGDPEIDLNDSDSIKGHLINISQTGGLLTCRHCGLKQKRYKRSYEKYIDIYLEHVDQCGNQVRKNSLPTNRKSRKYVVRLSEDSERLIDSTGTEDSIINTEANVNLAVNRYTSSKVDDNDMEMKEDIICGVCEQTVENAEWLRHAQIQHNYIAWKKGEPKLDINNSDSIKEHLLNTCKTFGLLICNCCGLKQRRYKRSYEKYIDLYLEHVDQCANQLLGASNVPNEIKDLTSDQEYAMTAVRNNSQSVNEIMEMKQTIICGVCDQAIENTEWWKHIQEQHNYMAWKKGDAEIDLNDSDSIKGHLINISKTAGLLICRHCGLKQKRYKRSYEKYIDIYLEHVDQCANQVLHLSQSTERIRNLRGSQHSTGNSKSNITLTSNDSTSSVADLVNVGTEDDIICGVCEQSVRKTEWLRHAQIRHNCIAWKKGEPELDAKNTYEVQEHLINLCNHIRYFFCNKCGLRINRHGKSDERYVLSFMYHIENCKTKTETALQDQSMTCNVNSSGLKSESEEISTTDNSENIQCVTCGVCHEVVPDVMWIEHTRIRHNYIAWPHGSTPVDLNDSREIETFLVDLTENIGLLRCYKCQMNIRRYKRTYENYIKIFLKHVEECDSNTDSNERIQNVVIAGPVQCAVCSYEMHQKEWNNHLFRKHYNLAWRKELDEPLDLQNTSVIIRQLKEYNKMYRKMICNNCGSSRVSILGFFAHIVACQRTEEEVAPFQFKCEICGASSLKVYYQQHMAGHKLQEINEEKKKQRLEMAQEEEEMVNETIPSGKRKAAHKAMAVLEKYKACKYQCDACEFSTDFEQELIDHKCNVDDTSSDDSTHLSMQSSNESSGEEDEDLLEDKNQSISKKKHSREPGQGSFTMPFSVKNIDAYLNCGCNKFMEFHYTNDSLFDEWLECPYEEVTRDKAEKYLPPLTESCKIKCDNQWTSYERFEARDHKGYSLFVGACISCMAWVPGPAHAHHMLAVATGNSIDTPRLNYDTLHEHPGLIQIWSCGSIGDNLPKFSLGIVHDFGTIWSMDWCPSGARAPLPEGPSCRSRLGLLAASCSNGLAYIFSVPHPSSTAEKFCKLHPVAELRVWTKPDRPKHQATAINWSKQKGHSIVVVGYSDGTTAVFDINCDSPILKQKDNNTTIFYPYSDDHNVCSTITGISVYPTMEVGDRATGLEVIGCSSTTGATLQLKAAGGPSHAVHSKLAVNGADFMTSWPALLISMDDNTSSKPLSELEVWGVGRRTGSARVIAACAYCPRLFTWTPPLLRSVRIHPLYPEVKRNVIAAIEMVPLNAEDQKPKRKKVDDDLCFKVEPTVYEDAILKYGIQFQLINSARRRRTNSSPWGVVRSDMYPLAEVSALAVCPSPARHNWLAIGVHAGFVLIIRT